MKFFLISDNVDTLMGLRLAGIEGEVVHDVENLRRVLNQALNDSQIAIVLITTQAFNLDRERIMTMKLELKTPLIVEISDRHNSHEVQAMLSEAISKIVGKVV